VKAKLARGRPGDAVELPAGISAERLWVALEGLGVQVEGPAGDHQEMLRRALHQWPGLLWTTDWQLRFTSGGGRGLADLRVTAEEVLGMTLAEYFGTEDPDFLPIAEHRRALAGHAASFDFEWAEVTYRVRLEPLYGEREVHGVLGVAEDVSS
jgi:PAS domain-containing protein